MTLRISNLTRKTLLIATLLLILSVVVRVFDISSMAVADESPKPATLRQPLTVPQSQAEISAIAETLEMLQLKNQELENKAQQLERRAEALDQAQEEFNERKSEMVQVRDELRETIALAEEVAESDLARLTAVYENMKPKDAARLFAEMDPTFAAGFISRMQPEQSADILAGMDPSAAYAVSAILAGRNVTP